ncbi:MAG: PAS domain S-box protein [Deltaproteobacteria bacterium]|nr:PAS domain S-box protein [Deltaproteobacteria bacterium]
MGDSSNSRLAARKPRRGRLVPPVARQQQRRAQVDGQQLAKRGEPHFADAILDHLPGIFYLYTARGKFLRWNRNFETVSGCSSAEVANKHPLDFISPADRLLVAERISEVFADGRSSVEAGFHTKAGLSIPYYFTGARTELFGETCLMGVGIDISKRKEAEEARTTSEGRYRTLFDYAPDGIVIADAESNYVDANPSMCKMLGYTREEFVRLNATDIVAASEAQHISPALKEITSRATHEREWQFKRKNGTTFPAEVIATQLPDGNLLAVIRDISERKAVQKSLYELNTSLERKVDERTAELKEALVRAEAADQIKSAFLATMSHELRTPLNSIIGFTGILLQGLAGPLSDEQRKQLSMVRSSGRHLLDLINDVLDLSKIEAGQLQVRRESFDLTRSIQAVIDLTSPLAQKKGLALLCELPGALPPMISDKRRFEQILINLVTNAIKFTMQGHVKIIVQLTDAGSLLAPGSGIRIDVQDTGMGIAAENLSRLFQPFSQVDTGLTRQYEGTGLGLAICRRLAGLMGGQVQATSTWAKGSTFSLSLPLEGAV